MRRSLRLWWAGLVWDWDAWREGRSTAWQALWGHNVRPWWKVPGFMRRFR